MAMLQVTDLKVNYGVIQAIKGVSFEVNEGEWYAIPGFCWRTSLQVHWM